MPGEEDGLLYAGGDPGVLFESRDGGATWELNKAFWEQPTRPEWSPGAGGLCLHSIATWPGDPSRLALAISAVGVWLTEDGGKTWRHGNKGLVPRYMPEEAREDTLDLCVHNLHRAPDEARAAVHAVPRRRLPLRRHRREWIDIADTGLPSDFGFPMVDRPGRPRQRLRHPARRRRRPRDAGRAGARVRDARRRRDVDARGDGLPADDAYLTILRQAFGRDGSGAALGLYFGATSGDVFGSRDAGATWFTAATNLPPVHSVRVA